MQGFADWKCPPFGKFYFLSPKYEKKAKNIKFIFDLRNQGMINDDM